MSTCRRWFHDAVLHNRAVSDLKVEATGRSALRLRDATLDRQVNAGDKMSTGRSPDSWRTFIEAQAGTRQDSADEMGGLAMVVFGCAHGQADGDMTFPALTVLPWTVCSAVRGYL